MPSGMRVMTPATWLSLCYNKHAFIGKPTSPHRYSFRWGLVFAIGSIETNAVECDATYSPYAGHRLVTGNADWHYLGVIHTALYGVAVVALGTLVIICHNLIASSTSKYPTILSTFSNLSNSVVAGIS